MLYPPFKSPSDRPSVRPSALRFHSQPGAFLIKFFNLGIIVDIGEECLGIAYG